MSSQIISRTALLTLLPSTYHTESALSTFCVRKLAFGPREDDFYLHKFEAGVRYTKPTSQAVRKPELRTPF